MTFTVRPVEEGSIPTLFAIRTAVRENHMSLDELAQAGVTPATVAAMLRSGDAAGWLGGCSGRPAGFSMARADVGDLFVIAVLPEFEGQGLGTLLLREAERWLALRGIGGPGC